MTALILVPTTDTIGFWLLIAGAALLAVTIASGVWELLVVALRRPAPRTPVRPLIDDLAHELSVEQEYTRRARLRLEQREREESLSAAEVYE